MRALALAVVLTGLAGPVLAQTGPVDPHAGHSMPAAAPPAPDPHAGHDMGTMQAPAAPDPHSGHTMPAPTPSTPDPHAGHSMPAAAVTAPDPHAGHDMSGMVMAGSGHSAGPPDVPTSADNPGRPGEAPPPPAAGGDPAHAADLYFDPAAMAEARVRLRAENGDVHAAAVLIDRLEWVSGPAESSWLWDAQGWSGGDIHRFWWKSEGTGAIHGGLEDGEVQALYSRAVRPFWDLQTGVRQTWRAGGGDRTDLVFGVQGVAPHWFDIDVAAFLSTRGELTARVELEYDQRLTQRLILQPRIEAGLSAVDIPELGIGAGLGTVEAGLRLRYEIRKELAPYVGLEWTRRLGATGDFARARGEDVDVVHAVVGLKIWF